MLAIKERYILLALHRALYAAKFDPDEEELFLLAGSPLLAEAYRRVIDAFIEAARKDLMVNEALAMEKWLEADNNEQILTRVREWLRRTEEWGAMSAESRRRYTESLLSPFRVSPDTF
jgi:hypothetical protein